MIEFIAAVLAGWLFADLATGFIHWFEDRIDGERWPLLGPLVFAPNRLHHQQPLAFTRSGFLTRNGTSAAAALAIGASIALVLALTIGDRVPLLVWVALAAATIGGALGNQVHYWSHLPHRAPAIVQAAQSIGLCQSRMHHSAHHAPPQRTRYCILTNWLNPSLDRFGVWQKLERLVPRRWLA